MATQRSHARGAGLGAGLPALAALLLCAAGACGQDAAGSGASAGAGAGGQMIADQAFQEPPSRPPIDGFAVHGGQWAARQGEVEAPAGDGPKLICEHPAFASGEAGVEVFFADPRGGNAGLIVKTSDCGVGADRFNGYEVALDPAGHLVVGRHRQNFESIRNVPCPVPLNRWIPLVVRMTEKTLEVDVDGKTVFQYEDREHPLARGQVGLRTWQREARFRNLWIRTGGQTRRIPFEAAPPGDDTSGPWRALRRGTAAGRFALETRRPFAGTQSQRLAFLEGQGEVGIENRGGAAGLPLVAGQPYDGCLWVRADEPAEVFVALEGRDGAKVLAEARLAVRPGDWQRLDFALAPAEASRAGRFAVKLKAPGSVVVGQAVLEPGAWAWPETLALGNLPPIAFITRQPLSSPNTISCDIWQSRPRRPGCSIRVVEPARPGRPVRTLFSDPQGCIYDMNVSYDARTLYFSYRRGDDPYWHIWRIGTDGTGLRQLTDGPHYDISPLELPDGDILFVSTRRGGYTVCQPGPASNLHRMRPDGTAIRCLSMNTLSDFSPQMLPDGRVLFTRWEYIDRDLTFRQSLWTQNPDGTGYQLYFGNTIREVGTFWQARPVPGRPDRVVATFAPHHGWPHGAIGLIDLRSGLEGPRGRGYWWITNEFPEIGDRAHEWSYRDPFPLTDSTFLCAYGGGGVNRFRLFLLDSSDRRRLVTEDPATGCYNPLPLRPVPVPPAVSPRALQAGDECGTFLLADVYRGLGPAIARGRVKYLRVMEQIRKTEDLVNRAYDQSPVMSYGTYYAKRCWGTVPVEEDGSAHFRAPALREIYFQVLDAEGRELQRMTSAAQVMPGETVSCVGCHEPRSQTPAGGPVPLAARRPPRDLEKPPWGNDGVVDFPTVVQPVLDKYCVKCHSGGDPDGGYDLTGDKTRFFSMAYDNLLGRSRSYRQHDMATGEMLPAEQARGKPLVHFYWLLRTPTAVNQPLWTGSHASRLLDYVDTDHAKEPIPLADRQRIYMWIDADVPYYGTYAHSHPNSPGRRDRFTDPATGREFDWFARDFQGVYGRRCASCHGPVPQPNDHGAIWDGRLAWINLSRPALSPALTAHLAKAAGGRGLTKPQDGKPPPVFADTADPDYQAMLKAIEAGKALMLAAPEADMPGFRFARKEP